MSAQAIRAGRAFVELFTDDTKLTRGLRLAQAKLQAWGAGVTSLGTRLAAIGSAGLAPLTAAAAYFSSAGDAVQKMSLRTGASAEALSQLAFAAQQSGSDVESLELGLRAMSRSVLAAREGTQGNVDDLTALGLSVQQLDGLAPDQLLERFADALNRIQDPTERAALAMRIFGRSGTQLLPLFSAGSAGIRQLREQADKLGLTMSTADAAAAANFTDAIGELTSQVKAFAFQIGAAIGGELARWIRTTQESLASAIDWAKANRGLVVSFGLTAAAVAAAGTALVGIGTVITVAGLAVGGLATLLTTLAGAVSFLFTPLGALTALVAGLGYAAVKAAADSQAFQEWKGQAIGAWDGLVQRVSSGDLKGAADYAFKAVGALWDGFVARAQLKWQELTQDIREAWASAKSLATGDWEGQGVAAALAAIQQQKTDLRHAIQEADAKLEALVNAPYTPPAAPDVPVPPGVQAAGDGLEAAAAAVRAPSGTISGLSDRMFSPDVKSPLTQIEKHTGRAARVLQRIAAGNTYAE